MEFSNQYLTYEEYKGLGGTIDLMPFNLLEFESRRKIDIKTQNRLKNIAYKDLPQEVKLCMYELINSIVIFNNATINANSGNIESENIDGYSVKYLTASDISNIVKSKSDELDDIIRTYLLGVIFNNEHLMYVGVE